MIDNSNQSFDNHMIDILGYVSYIVTVFDGQRLGNCFPLLHHFMVSCTFQINTLATFLTKVRCILRIYPCEKIAYILCLHLPPVPLLPLLMLLVFVSRVMVSKELPLVQQLLLVLVKLLLLLLWKDLLLCKGGTCTWSQSLLAVALDLILRPSTAA